ncbi:MAG: ABC transporter substrate-binding protein [Mycobacteriales bacterium]
MRRTMRTQRLRLLVAGCLLLTGCGMRLDHGARQALLQQSLRGGPAGQTGTTSLVTAAPTTGPLGAAPGTRGAGPAGPLSPGGAGGMPATQGPVVRSTMPPGGNGGSTDVGVTATSITVGTVADQTGPQPGLFDGDVAGVLAYFAYVNSQGGVNGRTLQAKVADSQTDCNQTTNAYQALVPSIFAFVGNLSNYDNCGATVLRANPRLPDVSFTLTPEHTSAPATYSSQPTVPGARTGPARVFASAYPEVKGAVGGLYADVASAKAQWLAAKAMLQAEGFDVVYEQGYPPTQVDFTQYVIGMRQKNVKMAVLYSTAAYNAKFINAAQQQGFTPPVIEAPGTLYDPAFKDAVGTAPKNLYTDLANALYANPEEARIKGVALYQQWMRKTAPDQPLDYFSVFGWTQAGLFVQALRDAGPRVTRAALIEALRRIHHFTSDDMIASADPGARRPVSCYLIAHYDAGVWRRWRSPADGFRCDAPYYYAKS